MDPHPKLPRCAVKVLQEALLRRLGMCKAVTRISEAVMLSVLIFCRVHSCFARLFLIDQGSAGKSDPFP